MKISARWLQQLFSFDVPVDQAAQVLTATGLEVEGVEHVQDVPGGLAGVVIGHVTSVEPHPNADHLRLCKVDVGEEVLDIVCGASNVEEGQKVPVPKLVPRCIRRQSRSKSKRARFAEQVSLGMICAEDELGLGTSHDGIMVLDAEATGGAAARRPHVGLEGDDVIEIGLTPNRNDAMGHWGVARDLRAGLLHGTVDGVGQWRSTTCVFPPWPNWTMPSRAEATLSLNIEAKDDCPHYLALELEDVKVGPSLNGPKSSCAPSACNRINNVVDATNLVLHEFGNPLHAFDMDHIGGSESECERPSKEKPSRPSTGKRERSMPTTWSLRIATSPCVSPGSTAVLKVGSATARLKVVLEAAWFHPVTVRKSAKRLHAQHGRQLPL